MCILNNTPQAPDYLRNTTSLLVASLRDRYKVRKPLEANTLNIRKMDTDEDSDRETVFGEYTDSENESAMEEDMYYLAHPIAEIEEEFAVSPKENGKWYLGTWFESGGDRLLNIAITPQTFLRNTHDAIMDYVDYYASVHNFQELEIMQVWQDESGEYPLTKVVLKTFWLRLVQRHWRKVCADRYKLMRRRMGVDTFLYFMREGKYPEGMRGFPTIRGMMKQYNNPTQ